MCRPLLDKPGVTCLIGRQEVEDEVRGEQPRHARVFCDGRRRGQAVAQVGT